MKKIAIIVVALIIIILFEIGIRSFILAPNISEFIPQFKNDGVYIYEDYQEDDFYAKDYFSYKYNIFTKEYKIEKPVNKEYGADSKIEALFSYPKEVVKKYKIYEYKKGDYIIYELFEETCLVPNCSKKDISSKGVKVESKKEFDYDKYITKSNKKLQGKYIFNYRKGYDDERYDDKAFIRLYNNGKFKVYKFGKYKEGTYETIKFKYNIHGEGVLLKYNDNNTKPIFLEIADNNILCDRFGICKNDLREYPIEESNSLEYRLDGEWHKVK